MTHPECSWQSRDDVFEGYVRGTLVPEERQAFERHYFECDSCARRIEAYQGLHRMVTSASAVVAGVPQPSGARPWWWVGLPVAAGVLLVVAAATLWLSGPAQAPPESVVAIAPPPSTSAEPAAPSTPPPAPVVPPEAPGPASGAAPSPPLVPLSVLARVEAPSYLPASQPRASRGGAAERFDAAMARYLEGDYAGAIPGLRAATESRSDAPQYAFFLAACLLLTGETERAVLEFQRTIALGESPFLEEAHFYLAKARLREGNLAAARDELTHTIERRGRLEAEARRLLAQLNAHTGGR